MISDEDPTSLLPLDSSGSDVVFVVDEYSGLRRSVSTLSFYGWAGRHDVCLDLKKSAWLGEFDLMLRRGAGGRLTTSVADDEGLWSLGLRLTHTDEAWSSFCGRSQAGIRGFCGEKASIGKGGQTEEHLRLTLGLIYMRHGNT